MAISSVKSRHAWRTYDVTYAIREYRTQSEAGIRTALSCSLRRIYSEQYNNPHSTMSDLNGASTSQIFFEKYHPAKISFACCFHLATVVYRPSTLENKIWLAFVLLEYGR